MQYVNPADVSIFDARVYGAPIIAQRQMQMQNALAQTLFPQGPGAAGYGGGTNALAAMADQNPVGGGYMATENDGDPRRGMFPTGTSPASYSTQFGFELEGKARPNKPNPQLLNVLGQAAEAALGNGARVVVYSGQENPGDQHGSNRHKTGLAADVRVYDPEGNLVRLNDPRAEAFALAAARSGARGIGAGAGYMGDAFHIDTIPHDQYSAGQGPVWGEWAKQRRSALLDAMGL